MVSWYSSGHQPRSLAIIGEVVENTLAGMQADLRRLWFGESCSTIIHPGG